MSTNIEYDRPATADDVRDACAVTTTRPAVWAPVVAALADPPQPLVITEPYPGARVRAFSVRLARGGYHAHLCRIVAPPGAALEVYESGKRPHTRLSVARAVRRIDGTGW